MWGEGSATLWSLALRPPPSPHWSATGLPDGRGHGRISQNRQCKKISGCGSPPYTHRVRGKAGRKGWQRSGNTTTTTSQNVY